MAVRPMSPKDQGALSLCFSWYFSDVYMSNINFNRIRILFYFTDEESPPPPPRPPSPPSSFPDRCSSFEQEVANPHISVLDEQPEQHTALVNEANTEKENIILNTTCAETSITFPNLDSLLDQDEFKCRSQDQFFVTMPSTNFCPDNFQEDTEPMFISASTSNNSLTQSCLGTDIRDLAKNTAKEIRDLKTASDNNESSTKHKLEKVLDRKMEVINKGNCRFDYLYHHVGQTKGWFMFVTKCPFPGTV